MFKNIKEYFIGLENSIKRIEILINRIHYFVLNVDIKEKNSKINSIEDKVYKEDKEWNHRMSVLVSLPIIIFRDNSTIRGIGECVGYGLNINNALIDGALKITKKRYIVIKAKNGTLDHLILNYDDTIKLEADMYPR